LSTVVKLGADDEAPLELEPPLDMLPELPLDELPDALGVELDELGDELEPLDELGEELEPLDAPDEPDEPLLPVALGEDDDLSLLEELELCAIETLASANNAAAVAVVISFNFIWTFLLRRK
jgi:hypothetical protein